MQPVKKKKPTFKIKQIFVALLTVLLLAQLVRPKKNVSSVPAGAGFVESFDVDERVNTLLIASCYDCHSNHTDYPWYHALQPFGWLMGKHVNDGKEKLNFDELPTYGPRRIRSKFTQIAQQIRTREMPLESYEWMHGEAQLSEEDRDILLDYFNSKLSP